MIYQLVFRPGKGFKFSYISPGSREIFGLEPSDLRQSRDLLWFLTYPEDLKGLKRSIIRSAKQLSPFEHTWRTIAGGQLRWVSAVSRPELQSDGSIIWDGLLTDITEQRLAEEHLRKSAERERTIARIIQRMRQTLKLEHIFSATTEELRDALQCDRVVIYRLTTNPQEQIVAEAVGEGWNSALKLATDEVREHLPLHGLETQDSVDTLGISYCRIMNHQVGIDSIDILIVDDTPENLRLLSVMLSKQGYQVRKAINGQIALTAAGKAQYRIFDGTMYRTALHRLQLEMELRQAIAERQFILHYQPIVDLRTGAIAGLEALVRWNHPTRLISPAEFIGVAEETGLINEIGTLVLREACHQLRIWQKQGLVDPHLSVSVNLSAYQFAQPDLMEQILQILAETELEPHCLKLELTESAIMQNADSATQILRDLRQHQIQLSMDDFGTGYSSLSYLRSFPMDYLKIDRSFVQGLDKTVKELNLVAVIVAIAQTMEMKVIAEGIETPDQLAQLRSLNCDFG